MTVLVLRPGSRGRSPHRRRDLAALTESPLRTDVILVGDAYTGARGAAALRTVEIVVPSAFFEATARAADRTGQKSFATDESKPNGITQDSDSESKRGNADP